jgi:two-component system, sensor histidine kinase PdtaS
MKTFFLFLSIILTFSGLTAQPVNADSLHSVINMQPDDTAKIRKLFDLAGIYYNTDLQKEGKVLRQGYRMARQLKAEEWLPRYQNHLGANHANNGRPDSALVCFNLAEEGFKKSGDKKQLASVFTKKRWVYNYLGNYEKALEYAFNALAIYEELDDEAGVAIAYSYIGEILYSQKKYQEAADYAQKGYDIQKRLGLKDDLAYSCQNLGDAWLQVGDYDKALAFQNEGLALRRELGLNLDAGLSLNSRGNVLKYMKRYPEALADYRESLEIGRLVDFPPLRNSAISNIGHILNLQGKYREALPYHLENMRLLQAAGEKTDAPENYLLLAEAYGGIGLYDSAFYFQKLHSEIKDSLLTEETSTRMSELQTKYETAQREAKIAVQEEKLKEQRIVIWAVAGILAIALIAGALLWRLSKQLRQRNREKEFLIKEIHHRVKNNLQVLASLLSLQSRHIEDSAALDAVREGQSRVEAMGLIHQKLYMGDNLAAVEMRDYLHNLGDTLLDTFRLDEDRVKIIYHLEPLHLDVDTAIPLGLIINELLTNSLKYAFPNGREGVVEISLWKNKSGKLSLKVADNGVGKNGAPELKNSTSFGTSLVQILSKKLKGTPVVLNGEGYATLIEFENFKEA